MLPKWENRLGGAQQFMSTTIPLSDGEKEDKSETASDKEETFEDTQLGIPDNDDLLVGTMSGGSEALEVISCTWWAS
jgi:hypothetical protein